MHTSALALNELPDDQLYRLTTMKELQDRGFSSAEIAEHLNQMGILTPTGQKYYAKLVWVTLDKYRKREAREKHVRVTVEQDYFFLTAP